MKPDTTNPLIEFIRELERETVDLPAERRWRLIRAVEAHIEDAMASQEYSGETGVVRLLSELGDPADLVEDEALEAAGAVSSKPTPWQNVVSWLTVGSLIPFVGWAYGVYLLWSSPTWRTRDKWIGTLLYPFGAWGVISTGVLMAPATLTFCHQSAAGAAASLNGPRTQASATGATICESAGGLPAWAAWSLLVLSLALAIAGPGRLWLQARQRPIRSVSSVK